MRVNTKEFRLSARDLVDTLASKGRYSFTSEEARGVLSVSADATKLALNRLIRRGKITSPARGYYVIVPPEYQSLGCLPADQFIPDLMKQKGLAYYAGLLSAAQYYGAAHQRPQEFQVFTRKNRRSIHCGKVRVKFVARKHIVKVSVRKFHTPRGVINVSTPEATAIDLAGYPEHVGGLYQVVTILSELAEEMDGKVLVEAARTAPLPWAQRLGYVLELIEAKDCAADLKKYVRGQAREYRLLTTGQEHTSGPRAEDWKLILNTELVPHI